MGTGVSMAVVRLQNRSGIRMRTTITPVSVAINKSRSIDKMLQQDKMKQSRSVRLLLLGTGESGKSTFSTQIRIIHHGSYDHMECMSYRDLIYSNVLTAMSTILQAMKTLEISFHNRDRYNDATLFHTHSKHVMDGSFGFTSDLADAISRLWKDPGVRKCYMKSNEYQLIDSASYFFTSVHRIAEKDYLPTDDDIVQSRTVTTGIHETKFQFRNIDFTLIDVGGQRTERRKWIHFFENVTAILFCVALSEYDQRIREDGVTNRMKESLCLFKKICSWEWFRWTPMILFLNKYDLFQQKVKRVPISVFFKHYKGTSDVNDSKIYICRQFLALNKCKDKYRCSVYHHYTTATDRSNVQFVFDAVMTIILNNTLSDVGLIL